MFRLRARGADAAVARIVAGRAVRSARVKRRVAGLRLAIS